jgi:hypothetical protein
MSTDPIIAARLARYRTDTASVSIRPGVVVVTGSPTDGGPSVHIWLSTTGARELATNLVLGADAADRPATQ